MQGKVVAKVDGFVITYDPQPAKRRGKNRAWVYIYPPDNMRMDVTLGFCRTIQGCFIQDKP